MQSLARAQSLITGDRFEDWHKSIEWAATTSALSNLTDGEFVMLIRQAQSQYVYQTVVQMMEEHHSSGGDEAGHDLLTRFVEDSSFSLREWMVAITRMSDWLKKRNQSADFVRSLGYIKCCAMSAGHLSSDLPAIVIDMLEQHGLEKL